MRLLVGIFLALALAGCIMILHTVAKQSMNQHYIDKKTYEQWRKENCVKLLDYECCKQRCEYHERLWS